MHTNIDSTSDLSVYLPQKGDLADLLEPIKITQATELVPQEGIQSSSQQSEGQPVQQSVDQIYNSETQISRNLGISNLPNFIQAFLTFCYAEALQERQNSMSFFTPDNVFTKNKTEVTNTEASTSSTETNPVDVEWDFDTDFEIADIGKVRDTALEKKYEFTLELGVSENTSLTSAIRHRQTKQPISANALRKHLSVALQDSRSKNPLQMQIHSNGAIIRAGSLRIHVEDDLWTSMSGSGELIGTNWAPNLEENSRISEVITDLTAFLPFVDTETKTESFFTIPIQTVAASGAQKPQTRPPAKISQTGKKAVAQPPPQNPGKKSEMLRPKVAPLPSRSAKNPLSSGQGSSNLGKPLSGATSLPTVLSDALHKKEQEEILALEAIRTSLEEQLTNDILKTHPINDKKIESIIKINNRIKDCVALNEKWSAYVEEKAISYIEQNVTAIHLLTNYVNNKSSLVGLCASQSRLMQIKQTLGTAASDLIKQDSTLEKYIKIDLDLDAETHIDHILVNEFRHFLMWDKGSPEQIDSQCLSIVMPAKANIMRTSGIHNRREKTYLENGSLQRYLDERLIAGFSNKILYMLLTEFKDDDIVELFDRYYTLHKYQVKILLDHPRWEDIPCDVTLPICEIAIGLQRLMKYHITKIPDNFDITKKDYQKEFFEITKDVILRMFSLKSCFIRYMQYRGSTDEQITKIEKLWEPYINQIKANFNDWDILYTNQIKNVFTNETRKRKPAFKAKIIHIKGFIDECKELFEASEKGELLDFFSNPKALEKEFDQKVADLLLEQIDSAAQDMWLHDTNIGSKRKFLGGSPFHIEKAMTMHSMQIYKRTQDAKHAAALLKAQKRAEQAKNKLPPEEQKLLRKLRKSISIEDP